MLFWSINTDEWFDILEPVLKIPIIQWGSSQCHYRPIWNSSISLPADIHLINWLFSFSLSIWKILEITRSAILNRGAFCHMRSQWNKYFASGKIVVLRKKFSPFFAVKFRVHYRMLTQFQYKGCPLFSNYERSIGHIDSCLPSGQWIPIRQLRWLPPSSCGHILWPVHHFHLHNHTYHHYHHHFFRFTFILQYNLFVHSFSDRRRLLISEHMGSTWYAFCFKSAGCCIHTWWFLQ